MTAGGVAVLLVEQDLHLAFQSCERITAHRLLGV
jgi:hypothetical protein